MTGGWTEEQLITSGKEEDKFGFSVSQTPDAKRLMIGAPYSNSESGMAYLFSRFNISSTFQLVEGSGSSSLEGVESLDRLGMSVSLALNGKRFVVGSPGRGKRQGEQYGSAIVCEVEEKEDGSTTILLSNEIFGDANQDFGRSVLLNGNGTMVVIGAPSVGIVQGYT